MIARAWLQLAAASCFVGAGWLVPPSPAAWRETAAWLARPALLPFAWRALDEANRSGDSAEKFARAQQILQLLPSWTDGFAVFAYRYALDGGALAMPAAERAAAALARLRTALTWLESARASAGRREVELLQSMAMLSEVAEGQEPGLAELLRPDGGSAALADRYLAEAERLSGSPTVREQRTFLAPWLCAGFLAAGDRGRAIAVLETAIARSVDVRDRALATEWAARLREVLAALRGGAAVDLSAVRQDQRMAPLLPHLR